jgi:hypothetical protein
MSKIEFGVWDAFGAYEVARSPVHALTSMSNTFVRSNWPRRWDTATILVSNTRIPRWARSPPPVFTSAPWPGTPAAYESER